jgi:hypothetical protein
MYHLSFSETVSRPKDILELFCKEWKIRYFVWWFSNNPWFTKYQNSEYIIEEELQIEEIQTILQPPALPAEWQNQYFKPSTSEDLDSFEDPDYLQPEHLHIHLIAPDESVSRSLPAFIFQHGGSFSQQS